VRFRVLPRGVSSPTERGTAFLETDRWDDYHFKTQFTLRYRNQDGALHQIGDVKIGQFGMGSSGSPEVPPEFERLEPDKFSLGQDDSYYDKLSELGEDVRNQILESLNDVALNLELFDKVLAEPVTRTSLLRSVSVPTVRNQFHRMALGGVRLTPFSFTYTYPSSKGRIPRQALRLSFAVEPESQPPTNIHVLIGPNGVGKTHLLNRIARVLLGSTDNDLGDIEFDAAGGPGATEVANLISVAFSAFDEFTPLRSSTDRSKGLQYSYIGLKKVPRSSTDDANVPKSTSALAGEFGLSVKACLQGSRPRIGRWRRALEMLETDPIFSDLRVKDLARLGSESDELLRTEARDLFRELSSGHKIVLLTITRLVETIEEKSLVLVDEPESHLHPPLLAAFVRALSDLLIDRNGVAIVATHSPVVLQEVPRRCVWRLQRSGDAVTAQRPQLETFGENVGTLTHEVFGLEVTNSGFHRMLVEAASRFGTYDEVVAAFDKNLGEEAKALVQGLFANQRGQHGDLS
jgi:ABC-type transport system involved in cytochrome c biogenesis ATPase subunit